MNGAPTNDPTGGVSTDQLQRRLSAQKLREQQLYIDDLEKHRRDRDRRMLERQGVRNPTEDDGYDPEELSIWEMDRSLIFRNVVYIGGLVFVLWTGVPYLRKVMPKMWRETGVAQAQERVLSSHQDIRRTLPSVHHSFPRKW